MIAESIIRTATYQRQFAEEHSQYLDQLSQLDMRKLSSFPQFKGDPKAAEMIRMANLGLGIIKSMEQNTQDKKVRDAAASLYPLIDNVKTAFEERITMRAQYLNVLDDMVEGLDIMELNRDNGLRTGDVYFRIGVQNAGRGDALLSPIGRLEYGDIELPVIPLRSRNYYTIVSSGQISEVLMTIDETNATDGALRSWKASVMQEQQDEFRIILSERDKEVIGIGRLPITEDVSDDVLRPR